MGDLQCPARLVVRWVQTGHASDGPSEDSPGLVWRALGEGPLDLVEVADVHRGEAVLVLVDQPPLQLPDLGPGQEVSVELDADGLRRVD